MSGESSVRELRATGLQGVSLGETEIALVDGENGRLDLPRSRCRAARAREHVRGHRLPALERAPAGRRTSSPSSSTAPWPAWSCPPRCTTRSARSGRTRWRWTSSARVSRSWGAMRGRAEGGDSEDALWALAATPAIVADFARLRTGAQVLAPDPELGIVENYLLKLSGEPPGARAGSRARRVFHPRRRARHERLDVHRARDRLDALRPRLGPGRGGRSAQGAAARRCAEPRLAHDRRDRLGRERRALAAPQARGAARS